MKNMKKLLIAGVFLSLLTTSCQRNANSVWEDTKSAGRHVNRGFRSLGGKHTDSRQVSSRDEFMPPDELVQPYTDPEYVPLPDDPNAGNFTVMNRPPRETPGEPGSSIPAIDAFKEPNANPQWSAVFKNIHFPYNSNLVKGEENLAIVNNVANYMMSNSQTYIFVEGHCDERGPEAYNLALGSNRSNAVRNLLINEGVNPDRIFVISYGKERPIVTAHDEESWELNRRAEFKIFERT